MFPESGSRPGAQDRSATGWFGLPSTGPRPRPMDRREREGPFWKRHFWPPSLLGGVALALVLAVVVGFVGAFIYTRSEIVPAEKVTTVTTTTTEAPSEAGPQAAATTVPELTADGVAKKVGQSVWSVNTLDEVGRPVDGSAFVAGSSGGQTFLLTSLALVRAATRIPAPVVTVRNGGTQLDATLWTWHEERDLALLAIPRTVPSLLWATGAGAARAGQKVYAATGSGGGVTPGLIVGASAAAIEHNVFVDGNRPGGPLLNARGEVLGVLSRDYDPAGTATDRSFFAVPVAAACEKVLACGVTTTTRPRGSTTTTRRPGSPTTTP